MNKIIINQDVQELIIIRGVKGSGKTTLAKEIINKYQYSWEENDLFFTDNNGNYKFDHNNIQYAKYVCLNNTRSELESGKSVVVSNRFLTLQEIEPYLLLANELDVKVNIIEMKKNNLDDNIEFIQDAQQITAMNYKLYTSC